MFTFIGDGPDGVPPGTVDLLEVEATSVSRRISTVSVLETM